MVTMSRSLWVMPWQWRARPAANDGEGPGPAPRGTVGATDPGADPPLLERLRRWWRAERWGQADDPRTQEVFAVLRMQMRLGTLAATLRRIDADAQMFARQHHWRITLWAYDTLLAEACALAGVPVRHTPPGPKADAERLRRELELYERGWQW